MFIYLTAVLPLWVYRRSGSAFWLFSDLAFQLLSLLFCHVSVFWLFANSS